MTKQDYGTPREFIAAVERRFGPLVHDLAAHAGNAKCPTYYTEEEDSLAQDWSKVFPHGNLWLNPPFKHIDPWAEKSALESKWRHGFILMLTPASVGAQWYAVHVVRNAMTVPLLGRLTFEGMPVNPKTGKVDAYPKDCMLSVFGHGLVGTQPPWDWRL